MFEKIAKIFLIFLPLALVTGPFLPDFFISYLGLFFLFEAIKNKLWHYFNHPFFYLFISFYFYLILISFLSINPYQSLESSLFYFRFIFFVFAVILLVDRFPNLINKFSISIILTLFFVTIDAYYQHFTGINFLGMKQEAVGRLSGAFNEEYKLGSYLSRLMPFVFFYLASLKSTKNWMMWLAMFFLISIDTLIYISGERTAFFYLFLVTISIIVFTSKFKLIRLFALFATISLIISINIFYPGIKNRMIDQTINQIGLIKGNKNPTTNAVSEDIYIFSINHQAHFITAYKMFLDKPFFGHGPKKFRILCHNEKYYEHYGCASHPHNTYAQLLAETGIIGTLTILSLFLFVVYIFIRQFYSLYLIKKKQNSNYFMNDSQMCLYIAILVSLWPFIPTGNFFGNWNSIIYFLPLGFLIKIKK